MLPLHPAASIANGGGDGVPVQRSRQLCQRRAHIARQEEARGRPDDHAVRVLWQPEERVGLVQDPLEAMLGQHDGQSHLMHE